MLLRYALPLLLATPVMSQYCEPSFLNGCFSWHSQGILMSEMEWAFDGDCTNSDHTDMSATVEPGTPNTMSVTSGNWTGCSVWVDLDENDSFDDGENLFHSYVGGDPGFVYIFDITVPATTPNGSYRMRVVSPWGSDGFLSTNENGYGPCGDFQYGNFDDFMLNVVNTSSIAENDERDFIVGPNPTTGPLSVTARMGTHVQRIAVWSSDGRLVREQLPTTTNSIAQLDITDLQAGIYRVQCIGGDVTRTFSVVKQ